MHSAGDSEALTLELTALEARIHAIKAELEAGDRAATRPYLPAVVYDLDDLEESDDTQTRRIDLRSPLAGARATPCTFPEPSSGRSSDAPRAPRLATLAPGVTFDQRYVRGELLGEGGMGEVRLYTDRLIGRAVAMKVLRPEAAAIPRLRERFLFEARVQGQLEHPSIVPVHDVGVRPDGAEYFTMKRVAGRTLSRILNDLRDGDEDASVTYTRYRLLRAFQSVCLAVELAHQRGIIHRDLKPSNIMLGSFGEVSMIDWGIAKQVGQAPSGASQSVIDPLHEPTAVGELLGTPGYISPEYALGEEVTAKGDVFALGAILFEILTLDRFIPGDTDTDVRLATLTGAYESRISLRCPELGLPQELDALCASAVARDPEQRLASARELHDAIERFLEGESDAHRRRALAFRHAHASQSALLEATESVDPAQVKAARARALQEATRSLALDAENAIAVRTIVKLVTEVADTVAPEAEEAVQKIEGEAIRKTARRASLMYLLVISNLAMTVFLGVESYAVLGIASAFLLCAAAFAFVASRPERLDQRWGIPIIAFSSCGFAMTSGLFGPFVYAPALVAANVMVAAVGLRPSIRTFAIACGVAAVVVPVALQYFGVLPHSWLFEEGRIAIVPRVVRFSEVSTTLFLIAMSVGTVVLPAWLVGIERDARAVAERRLALQAHQLEGLVPAEAKGHIAAGRHPAA